MKHLTSTRRNNRSRIVWAGRQHTLRVRALFGGITGYCCAALLLFGASSGAVASGPSITNIEVEQTPLYLIKGAEPNLFMSLDDSDSMLNANVSGDIPLAVKDPRATASVTNPIYYDPDVTYLPPRDAGGTAYPDALFGAAPRDFFRDAFFESCTDAALIGPLLGKHCDTLFPSGKVTDCLVNLAANYAPLWRENKVVAPCDQEFTSVTAGGNTDAIDESKIDIYTIDPGHPDYLGWAASHTTTDSEGLETPGLPPTSKEWAAYCVANKVVTVANGASTLTPLTTPPTCPAFYYKFLGSKTYENTGSGVSEACNLKSGADIAAMTPGPWLDSWLANCLTRVDPSADEFDETNFANWYTYYRNRWRAMQSALTQVLPDVASRVRLGYQWMPPDTTDAVALLKQSLAGLTPARKQAFFDWLFTQRPTQGDTLLLAATRRILDLCQSTTPYLPDPQAAVNETNPEFSAGDGVYCRNNFHLIFTDGIWNDLSLKSAAGATTDFAPFAQNIDGSTHQIPTEGGANFAAQSGVVSTGYVPVTGCGTASSSPTRIYSDCNSESLADLAFYSWINDLRPNNQALVPTLIRERRAADTDVVVFWNRKNDPADWQHITTYSVGLGTTGEINYPDGTYNAGASKIETNGFPGNWNGFASTVSLTDTEKQQIQKQKADDLWHAAINGRGEYFSVKDPKGLIESFAKALSVVSTTTQASASAAPAINSGSASTDRFAFQATYNSEDWTGDLIAYKVSADGLSAVWHGAQKVSYYATHLSERVVATGTRNLNGTSVTQTPVDFADLVDPTKSFGDVLSHSDGNALRDSMKVAGTANQEAAAKEMLDFIRGNTEEEDDITFRVRPTDANGNTLLLGDIINGAPVVVAAPHRTYLDSSYATFRNSNANRTEIVYVGANDGMLHAFKVADGTELFAYVPRPLFGKLYRLAQPDYGRTTPHTSYVDGPIAEGDVKIGSAWRSVVIGALGMGAQGVYAIHSPDSDTIDATKIHMWDFTDQDDPDMGYVLGKPSIVRVVVTGASTPQWVTIFGNGINSSTPDGRRAAGCSNTNLDSGKTTCGQAVLYVLGMDGKLITKFITEPGARTGARPLGEPNGLSQPTVIGRPSTAGGDPVATVAYAGDLYGNLWRFDLTNLTKGATEPTPATLLFRAVEPASGATAGQPQPITAGLAVASHPTGVGTMILFGTGRYLGFNDVTPAAAARVQTFYGIWDRLSGVVGATTGNDARLITRADLQPQYFKEKATATVTENGTTVITSLGRTSTAYPIAWATKAPGANETLDGKLGWRIDLGLVTDPASLDQSVTEGAAIEITREGERVTTTPQVRGERVVFVSLIPGGQCESGGQGWINALSYGSGAALRDSPFDYTRDGTFDSADLLTTTTGTNQVGTSIQLVGSGIYSAPAAMPVGPGASKILVSDSKGQLAELLESSALKWRVWREVR